MKKKINISKALKDIANLEDSEEADKSPARAHVPSQSSSSAGSARGDEGRGSALDAVDGMLSLPGEEASNSKAKTDSKEEKKSKKDKGSNRGAKSNKKKASSGKHSDKEEGSEEEIDNAIQGMLEDGEEEDIEAEEEGTEAPKKGVSCSNTPKRRGGQVQPPTHSKHVRPASTLLPAIAESVLEQVESDFDASYKKIPSSRRDQQRDITGYLTKLQALVLRKAEAILKNATMLVSPVELIKMVKELKDMELSTKWQRKLEKAILENPSKLLPPGQRGGWTLLSKVKENAQQLKQAVDQDSRKSGIKKGEEIAKTNNISLEMPDDSSEKKSVSGA